MLSKKIIRSSYWCLIILLGIIFVTDKDAYIWVPYLLYSGYLSVDTVLNNTVQ
jgi:hypothetical protein